MGIKDKKDSSAVVSTGWFSNSNVNLFGTERQVNMSIKAGTAIPKVESASPSSPCQSFRGFGPSKSSSHSSAALSPSSPPDFV